jgi:ketosteroid isomerase-like protein
MSQVGVEALRPAYEAMGRGDWDAVFRDAHPDFELKTPDRGLGAGEVRGREQASRAFADFFEPYEEVVAEPQEVFEHGDRIVVFFALRSRPRGSSSAVEIRAAHLWTMRNGRAARCEIFPVREEALKAAGIEQ